MADDGLHKMDFIFFKEIVIKPVLCLFGKPIYNITSS